MDWHPTDGSKTTVFEPSLFVDSGVLGNFGKSLKFIRYIFLCCIEELKYN